MFHRSKPRDPWLGTKCPLCTGGFYSYAWPVMTTPDTWRCDAGHEWQGADQPAAVAAARNVKTYDWKLTTCPGCGEQAGVHVIAGYPSEEGTRAAELGYAVLYGCLVGPDTPNYVCRACGRTWQRQRAE